MKYFCCENIKITPYREKSIRIMYPRIKTIQGIKELEEIAVAGDVIVFDSVLELDKNNDISAITENYMRLYKKGIELIFDRSPNCDSEIVGNYANELGLGTSEDDEMFEKLLGMQIEAYINIREASANAKKYSQLSASISEGKQYGRPKGSNRDSEKAIRNKEIIQKESKDFDGSLSDEECMLKIDVSRNTFYRYKKQLKQERGTKDADI